MSIPASYFVSSNPSVLAAGGSAKSLNAVFATYDPSIPIGTAQPFSSYQDVADWFGATAPESVLANVYFSGFNNAQQLPTQLWFAQFNLANVGAYLRGGTVAGMSLATLQGLSGAINIVVDGNPITTSTINLSAATSFSNAATIITSALGSNASCTFDSLRQAFVISSPSSGTGSTVAFPTDGALSPLLYLTQPLGAVLSQGAVATTPAAFMNSVVAATLNFGTYMTVAEQTLPNKLAFAAWNQGQNQQYAYVCQDSDLSVQSSGNTGSFGPLTAAQNGIIPVFDLQSGAKAAFICGAIASIDFDEENGYTDLAFKSNGFLAPDVTDATIASALQSNGYSFYCDSATANENFQFLFAGGISGEWDWIDEYVAQINFNSGLVAAGMALLTTVKSLPNNAAGDNMIRAAMQDPIQAAQNFGTIQTGVALSQAQKAELATAAGVDISTPLTQDGVYLQIVPATAAIRKARGPRQVNVWYTNGGGVHKINISSVFVQ